MLQLIADTHTHSLVSGDAYSTISENAAAARRAGLRYLGITDHASATPGAPPPVYFQNLTILPKEIDGVQLLRGAEVNVMDFAGTLDLPAKILAMLDWVIASMHALTLTPGTKQSHTAGWLAIAENPDVDVIGHCGDPAYDFEHDVVLRAFRDRGKIVEINALSFLRRPGSAENCRAVAKLCMKYGIPVVVSSDAHVFSRIGNFAAALEMLEDIGFPEELILNASSQRLQRVLDTKITQAWV